VPRPSHPRSPSMFRSWWHRCIRRQSPRGQRTAPLRRDCPRTVLLEPLEARSLLSFLPAVHYGVGDVPAAVATGDFDGDGLPDLGVANSGSGTVSVLLGHGDGSFQDASDFVAGPFPRSVAVGDFNGDGAPDLAVANFPFTVSVLLGNGDGSFQAA